MRFKVLGPLRVTRDDGPLTLGGPKQRAVLAHLLVRANELVPADVLIDQVWGEDPPEAARGTLHSYISHLRKALGADRIESRPPGYVLHISNEELDAARFQSLLNEARLANGSPGRASSVLREALALWGGPPFADLAPEPALASEIARLDELHWQALEERIAADLAEGRHAEVIGELESLTRELPLRERLWELEALMLAIGQWEQARVLAVGTGRPVWMVGRAGIPDVPDLTFSPDATHLFVGERSADDSTAPTLVDLASGAVTATLPDRISEGEPSFSADGARVAFQHDDGQGGTRITAGTSHPAERSPQLPPTRASFP